MSRPSKAPTAEQLGQLLTYDPIAGTFTWKVDRNQLAKAGMAAGYTRRDGYLVINVSGRGQLGHRLAWLLMTGHWPEKMVDHINGDPSDNRWSNLREATRSQNMMNMVAVPPRNTSGVKGVSFSKRFGVFEAYITVDGHRVKLGMHRTLEAAAAARRAAEKQLFGEFARSAA